MSDSLLPQGLQFTRLLCPWSSPGKNTGMGCHSLLQGIFLTQGSNTCLLHSRQILYHLSYKGSSNEVKSKLKKKKKVPKDNLACMIKKQETFWVLLTYCFSFKLYSKLRVLYASTYKE